jgi:hypothetical protein
VAVAWAARNIARNRLLRDEASIILEEYVLETFPKNWLNVVDVI